MRALVTGITGNVGKAAANLLRLQGWDVVGISRNSNESEPNKHQLNLTVHQDVIEFVLDQQPFDLVVMAHGTQHGVELGDSSFMDWYTSVVDNNLTSAVILTNELIAWERLNYGSLIVYCSSIQATQPRKGRGPYSVAKAGLEALTKIVAVEQTGRVRTVALRLGQLSKTMANITFDPAQVEAIRARTLTDWPEPEEVARFVMVLYEQPGITGAVLDYDSGHNLVVWPT
jgi:NAD(P)-dependent dehydrogenase (short-subunit alcohol dehydrogenase family)